MDNEKKCLSCADCGVMNCALRNGTYPEFCPTAALTEEEINEITKLYTNNRVNKKIAFPTARSASAFIIGLSVWFPTVVLTSSGISNVKKSYFEVGSALGTNTFWNIFKIAVSSAMPNIFLGQHRIYNNQKKRKQGKIRKRSAMFIFRPQGTLNQAVTENLSARYRFANANMIFSLAVCFRRPRYRVFRYWNSFLTIAKTCSTLHLTDDFSCSFFLA